MRWLKGYVWADQNVEVLYCVQTIFRCKECFKKGVGITIESKETSGKLAI